MPTPNYSTYIRSGPRSFRSFTIPYGREGIVSFNGVPSGGRLRVSAARPLAPLTTFGYSAYWGYTDRGQGYVIETQEWRPNEVGAIRR
jgi:hypothetical protein